MLRTVQSPPLQTVKVSADDAAAQYLADTLVAGTGVTITVIDTDGVKTLRISSISGGGNMSTSVYDVDNNGVVDEAERIDGGSFQD